MMKNDLAEGEIMAAHTPKKLQNRCIDILASNILKRAFPCCMKRLTSVYESPSDYDIPLLDKDFNLEKAKDPRHLDLIIMSTNEREMGSFPVKMVLMERLNGIREWFNQTEWLGGPNSELRRRIRTVMSEKLELIDPYSFIPLFKFIIEALFSIKVGGCSDAAQFPFLPRVNCELWRKDCPLFADVIRSFCPFEIEELSTHHLAFGGPEPLLAITENSPYLKRVFLRNNISERLLMSIQKNCPLIDTFYMEKCMGELMISVSCLYRTFFCGMSYDQVKALAGESMLEKQRHLSFPRLKHLNLGKMDDIRKSSRKESMSLFVYTLLSFYSHPVNVTSSPLAPFSPALPEELPDYLQDISYRVLNCSLNGLKLYCDMCTKTEDCIKEPIDSDDSVKAPVSSKNTGNIIVPVERVHHLTLCHTHSDDSQIKELVEFSKTWVLKLGCKTFYLYTWQDIDYNVDISVYNPMFYEVGNNLTSFHFNIVGDVDLSLLCDIISMCSNLESLRLKLSQVHIDNEEKLKIKKLWKLTNLTLHSGEDCVPSVHQFIEKLLESSPELYSLSLVLHDKPCEWLMSLATSKKLSTVTILKLSFHCFNFSCREITDFLRDEPVGVPFYVFLIELLSNLKVLYLGSLPHVTFQKLIQIYRKSDLQIGIWHVPADSKEWYGGYPFSPH